MMSIDTLRDMLLAAFPGAQIEIADMTGTSDHFEAVVTSRAFEGKSRIEQHKLVYAALGDHVGKAIHALALTTRTPPVP
jgi:stress-induced morphogen